MNYSTYKPLSKLRKLVDFRNKRARTNYDFKIFNVGFNKTGTTSLHQAFLDLGFRSIHTRAWKWKDMAVKSLEQGKFEIFYDYDAFPSGRYWRFFRELDGYFPNAKFILCTRDLDGWLQSCAKHVTRNKKNANYKGTWLKIDIEKWREERERVHPEILKHFRDRPGKLLVFDIAAGDGYEKLCPFLGVPIPVNPFPFRNRGL